nr:NERD domain-containing protein [Quadrisphaera sp. RL12-1S]
MHQWTAGAEGEQRTAAALEVLEADGWQLLHDVHWPGRPKANLDHVAVGPGGVVVVDAKRWSGDITVTGAELRLGSWRKTRDCENAARMASDVASLLAPQHRTAVASVLCLVGKTLPPTAVEAGVVAVGDAHLADHLRSLPRRFDDDDVSAVTAQLRDLLAGATSPPVLTASAWEERTAPVSVPSLAVLGSVAAPTRRSTRSERAASGRAVQDRRVRRRQASSKLEYVVVRLGLLGALVGGYYLWVGSLGR